MDGATPVRYGLLLCNDATVEVLKKELSILSGVPVNQLVITETFGPVISVDFFNLLLHFILIGIQDRFIRC